MRCTAVRAQGVGVALQNGAAAESTATDSASCASSRSKYSAISDRSVSSMDAKELQDDAPLLRPSM